MSKIYTSGNLRYRLAAEEYELIDEVWDFIRLFSRFVSYNLHQYRVQVIEEIRRLYTLERFYVLERIAEKLFWNLRERACKSCKVEAEMDLAVSGSIEEVMEERDEDNSYRSFVNKLVLIADVGSKPTYYYKKMEGSGLIFAKNRFNLCMGVTFFNRELYEKTMMDPSMVNNIAEPPFYFQYDYPFPNLNYGKAFVQTEGFRKKRIGRMYFDGSVGASEENWFKLIRP
ncbi:MAG: hypothetical protein Hyperionvirus9_32 [Hyperionvirus sp.]|uniref:Uncharacterized protein n=1 Tax=Hyperionvirus sp. TaxID=2487770 RepID=A0A3G5A8Q6_9VIRU|nr:MAG: hypothetical protein Hyperionvirus9_32 [Hyperionvirus sp.]